MKIITKQHNNCFKKYLSGYCGWVSRFLCNIEDRTRMGSSGGKSQDTFELKSAFPSLYSGTVQGEIDWLLYFMVGSCCPQTAWLPCFLLTLRSCGLVSSAARIMVLPKAWPCLWKVGEFYSFQWMKSTWTQNVSWEGASGAFHTLLHTANSKGFWVNKTQQ